MYNVEFRRFRVTPNTEQKKSFSYSAQTTWPCTMLQFLFLSRFDSFICLGGSILLCVYVLLNQLLKNIVVPIEQRNANVCINQTVFNLFKKSNGNISFSSKKYKNSTKTAFTNMFVSRLFCCWSDAIIVMVSRYVNWVSETLSINLVFFAPIQDRIWLAAFYIRNFRNIFLTHIFRWSTIRRPSPRMMVVAEHTWVRVCVCVWCRNCVTTPL